MPVSYPSKFVVVSTAVLIACALGCSAITKPFKSSTRMDLGPFAENTEVMLTSVDFSFAEAPTYFLREASAGEQAREYLRHRDQMRVIMRAIVAYSIEVVTLSESRLGGKERAKAYCDFFDSLIETISPIAQEYSTHITAERRAEIMENARSRGSLFEALREVQPLVDEAMRIAGELLASLKESQMLATDEISGWIETEFEEVLAYEAYLKERQRVTLRSLRLVADCASGEGGGVDDLRSNDPALMRDVPDDALTTTAGIEELSARLMRRLETMDTVRDQLEPDLKMYRDQITELDALVAHSDRAILKARVAVMVWARVHRKLAAGVTDPAQIDAVGIMKSILEEAAGDVNISL
jgi:vacuolar-type H+-ATPase subunit I/STV1